MSRDGRPGDWAAWMSGGSPSAPASEPQPATTHGAAAPVGAHGRATAAAPSSTADVATAPRDTAVAVEIEHEAEPHRSARREATCQRILDAAREVFADKGVIGGTVEDICERAGFTRGAFYSNFSDKDEVVGALVEREHSRLVAHLDASFDDVDREVAEAGSLEAAVASIVDQVLRTIPIDRQLSLVQTELEVFAIRRPDQANRFVEINDRFRQRIATFLESAVERYGYELQVDALTVTDTAIAIAQSSVRRALLSGGDADPDAMAVAVLPRLLLAVARPAPAT